MLLRSLALLVFFLAFSLGAQVQKVSGDYRLYQMKALSHGMFKLSFVAKTKSGSFDRLELVSDHIHFGVKKGAVLRIAGEVAHVREDGVAELSQVMVLLPSREGKTPIWMLSKKFRSQGLHGSRYLEMHAPNADYLVF